MKLIAPPTELQPTTEPITDNNTSNKDKLYKKI